MNTMPGFSAEASLYRSSAPLQIRPMLAGLTQEGEVVPSIWMRDPTEVEGSWFDAGCDERTGFCWTSVWVGNRYLTTICDRGGCWQYY